MTIIYVEYSESSVGGEKLEPNEPWSDRSDVITNFEIVSVSLYKPDSSYYETFDLTYSEEPKSIYAIYVRYGTGNTFGREYGCGKVIDVCLTEAEAEAILDTVENGSHPFSTVWTGYFERLESCSADLFSLNKTRALHRSFI